MNLRLILTFLIVLILGLILSLSGFSDFRDYGCRKLFNLSCFELFPDKNEKLLFEKIKENKHKSLYFVDFEELFGNNLKKVCLQRPYELKESFYKKSKINISEFASISNEDRNIVWLFYKNGNKEALTVNYELYENAELTKKLECTEDNFKFYFE